MHCILQAMKQLNEEGATRTEQETTLFCGWLEVAALSDPLLLTFQTHGLTPAFVCW